MSSKYSGTYVIDPNHTSVEFAVRHMMITTVKGRFSDVQGTIELPEVGEPRVDVTIGTASIDTRSVDRDAHLRSADFFETEKFPTMRFVSTAAKRVGEEWQLSGDLTIRGTTKPVTLRVVEEGSGVDPWGNQKPAFSATGKLNRKDYGLNWNATLETGGVLVSDDVKLALDVQLVKQKAAQAA